MQYKNLVMIEHLEAFGAACAGYSLTSTTTLVDPVCAGHPLPSTTTLVAADLITPSSTNSPEASSTGLRDVQWQRVHQSLLKEVYPTTTVNPPATTPAIVATQKHPQPLTMSP